MLSDEYPSGVYDRISILRGEYGARNSVRRQPAALAAQLATRTIVSKINATRTIVSKINAKRRRTMLINDSTTESILLSQETWLDLPLQNAKDVNDNAE